jgi:cell division transport system permease protein
MRIFFFREALRALKRNAAPSLAAFATVLITTLVLGVFIPVVRAATAKTNQVRNKIELEVYIKAQALQILKHRLGSKSDPITQGLLQSNPLPASYRIHLDDPANVGLVKNSLQPRGTDGRPHFISGAINDIQDRQDDTKKILSATSTIKLLLAVLASLLVLASILLVANTIRLSIFARRREVEVMRLVGATNWFIRWPFVIEGLVVGFFGATFAVVLLWVAKVTVVDPWSKRFALIAAPRTISFTVLVLVLLGAGTAVSALGSGLTLRRFLRV